MLVPFLSDLADPMRVGQRGPADGHGIEVAACETADELVERIGTRAVALEGGKERTRASDGAALRDWPRSLAEELWAVCPRRGSPRSPTASDRALEVMPLGVGLVRPQATRLVEGPVQSDPIVDGGDPIRGDVLVLVSRLLVGDLTGWLWTGLIERISQDRRSRTCGEDRRRARSRSF